MPKILVVEPDSTFRPAFAFWLTRATQAAIAEAADLYEAEEMLRRGEKFQLVIMGFFHPQNFVCFADLLQGTPVVVYATAFPGIKEVVSNHGGTYVQKPASMAYLKKTITGLLST